ncbi:MAG: HAMP domain-containing sensor histidine kinase [Flavobacteriales bacterium]
MALVDKRWIAALLVGITLALAGLTIIQVQWIRGVITLRDAQFGQSIDDAMNEVSERIERADALAGIKQHSDGGRMLAMIDSMQAAVQGPAKGGIAIANGASDASDGAVLREALVDDMVRGILFGNTQRPISERLDENLLDSLVREELRARGILEPAVFAVVADTGAPMILHLADEKNEAGGLLSTAHRTRLFRADPISEPHWLLVFVPGQRSHILRGMGWQLAIGGLLVLIIAGMFVFTLVTIVRQRRMGQIKNDLVNNLTHELKTPIATIALACEALTDPSLPKNEERTKTFTNMIRDENKRLGVLVESVLQSAVLDSGRMRLRPVDLDMHAVIAEVARNTNILAERRNGRISTDLKADLANVKGDRIHLANVLYNLVDNAVKYCEKEPRIIISTTSNNAGLAISVQDNGIGIAKAELKRIFDRLYRVPTGNLHNVKGFGLGLSYVKSVVEGHGGRISVESEPGMGSTFRINIPFEHGRTASPVGG